MDFNIIPNESNNSIDITDLIHEMRAKYNFSLGTVPLLVLVGDMSSILQFISPFYPLFNEVNRGYELKLVTNAFTTEFVNLPCKFYDINDERNFFFYFISPYFSSHYFYQKYHARFKVFSSVS